MTDPGQRTGTPLEATAKVLGEGSVFQLEGGETLFKLDSFPGNPILDPQELGLTWAGDDGEQLTGAVFNGGAELLEGRVVLTPRCHQKYVRRVCFDEALETECFSFENYISEVWPLVSEDGVPEAPLLCDVATRRVPLQGISAGWHDYLNKSIQGTRRRLSVFERLYARARAEETGRPEPYGA